MGAMANAAISSLYAGVNLRSKVFSGIEPNDAHLSSGGYHVARDYIIRNNGGDYSTGGSSRNASPRDRGGRGDTSSAIDIGFSTADMITVTNRLINAMHTTAMRGVREFNGTADGRNTLNRDAVLGWSQNYTPDDTHLWHVHIGFFRDTANDWNVIKDVMAVINGTSPSAFPSNGSNDEQEDDMFSDNDRAMLAFLRDRINGVTPAGEYYVVKDGAAVPATKDTPGAKPVELLDTMAGNSLRLRIDYVRAEVAALDAKLDRVLAALDKS